MKIYFVYFTKQSIQSSLNEPYVKPVYGKAKIFMLGPMQNFLNQI